MARLTQPQISTDVSQRNGSEGRTREEKKVASRLWLLPMPFDRI
jgi:hypothetical protein